MPFILTVKGCEEEIHIIQRFLTFSPMNLLREQLSTGGVVGICTNLLKFRKGLGLTYCMLTVLYALYTTDKN